MRLAWLVSVLHLASACTGASGDRPAGGAPSSGRADAALLVGSPTPSLVSLDMGQRRAIGAFERDDVVRCTGTVVAPRRVLTAAHCFAHEPDLGPFDFTVAGDTGASLSLPIQRVDAHASLDLAIVTLGSDTLTASIPIRFDYIDVEVPAAVEAAGAGLGSGTAVTFGIFDVTATQATHLLLTSAAGHGLCGGDSGGPVLHSTEGGVTELVAVASTSAPNCGAPALAVRPSAARDWLEEALMAPLPEPSELCDEAEDLGRCRASVGESCRAGWWRLRDCAAAGLFCGALPGGGDGCLPAPCGNVDRYGLCDGGTALWCDDRGLEQLDCAARGLGCGFDAAMEDGGGFRCLDCTACGGECVDFLVNTAHCGQCESACAGDCALGRCVVATEPEPQHDRGDIPVVPPAPAGCRASAEGRAGRATMWPVMLALLWLIARRHPRVPFWRS